MRDAPKKEKRKIYKISKAKDCMLDKFPYFHVFSQTLAIYRLPQRTKIALRKFKFIEPLQFQTMEIQGINRVERDGKCFRISEFV